MAKWGRSRAKRGEKELIAEFLGFTADENGNIYNKLGIRVKTYENFETGYFSFSFDGLSCLVHRYVFHHLMHKIPEKMVIDHINRDRTDNRFDNLRCVTIAENNKNRTAKGNTWYNEKFVREYEARERAIGLLRG